VWNNNLFLLIYRSKNISLSSILLQIIMIIVLMNYIFLDSGYYENKHLEKLFTLYITWNHNNTLCTFDINQWINCICILWLVLHLSYFLLYSLINVNYTSILIFYGNGLCVLWYKLILYIYIYSLHGFMFKSFEKFIWIKYLSVMLLKLTLINIKMLNTKNIFMCMLSELLPCDM
jgi:hypothetical protein